jgi:dihydroxy-acid dehydratase
VLCKVSPNSAYHIEDVNRAGGIATILGLLARAGVLDTTVGRVDYPSLAAYLDANDTASKNLTEEARTNYLSAPSGLLNIGLGTNNNYYESLECDREKGCIRDFEHAYFNDGGLGVLFGNIALDGCIIKTAGVDEALFHFEGSARVFESQEQAMNGILNDEVKAGEVVVIRYEGPKGGPGMQEMLYPTSYLKSKHLDKQCALITDGRFSGGTSGLSIGHISPEAAAGGDIALIETGDRIVIDIPSRSISLEVSDEVLAQRRQALNGTFAPKNRDRVVPRSLRAYAMLVSSADKGAVRMLPGEDY